MLSSQNRTFHNSWQIKSKREFSQLNSSRTYIHVCLKLLQTITEINLQKRVFFFFLKKIPFMKCSWEVCFIFGKKGASARLRCIKSETNIPAINCLYNLSDHIYKKQLIFRRHITFKTLKTTNKCAWPLMSF